MMSYQFFVEEAVLLTHSFRSKPGRLLGACGGQASTQRRLSQEAECAIGQFEVIIAREEHAVDSIVDDLRK
jgi:hypothetical protein